MPKIELTIEAKIDALNKAIEGVGKRVNEINRKSPLKPIDAGAIDREGDAAVKVVERHQERINQAAEKADAKDAVRQKRRREADDAEATNPRDDRIRHSIRRRYTYAPEAGDIGRSLIGGFGGGVGQVAGYASRGAMAGAANGGGLGGGAAGLLRGGLIGAGVLAAFKIGQTASEGYDMASERAHTLDTLKRQMGDVGVSFERLKIASEAAASGLAINSKDFAAVEATLNVASGRANTLSPLELAAGANTTSGFARAYGMDPNQTASLFGAAKNVDPKRQYTEFAGILAQTIERTGKAGSAQEVTQAVLSFAATASRLSLSQANISGYAGAYAGLTNMGLPGLTSEASAGILAQANAAASNMGAAGEAGQAFTLAAFNRRGAHLNPLEAMALSSGGLFASRASVFAADTVGPDGQPVINSEMGHLLGSKDAARLSTGKGADTTVFDMISQEAKLQSGGNGAIGKELQAEMMQRYFGLQSMQQAAALMEVQKSMKPGDMQGFDALLKRAGVEVKNFNPTNIQTLAKISGGKTTSDLDAIYADLKTRTGTAALSKDDTDNIEAQKGKGFTQYQEALVKATATKDYAQDSYTVQQQMDGKLADIKIAIGDTLLGGITHLESTMITMLGGREKFAKAQLADDQYIRSQRYAEIDAQFGVHQENANLGGRGPAINMPVFADEGAKAKWQAERAKADEEYANTLYTQGLPGGHAPAAAQTVNHISVNVPVAVDKSGNVTRGPTTVTTTTPRGSGTQANYSGPPG